MTHQTANMAMMERGTERLCQGIGRIDDARDVRKHDFLGSLPLLKCKMLFVDVTSTWSGTIRINHQDGRGVVLEQNGRTELRVSELR